MLSKLYEAEHDLPELLEDEAGWQDLFVDYHHPFVERLWRPYGEDRLYLHLIHPCTMEEALFHPHAWPSIMRLHGPYSMTIGYGAGDEPPPVAGSFIMPAGTIYEMTHPDLWHAVRPVERAAMSVMLTGKPSGRRAPKSDRALSRLTPERRRHLFQFFRDAYPR